MYTLNSLQILVHASGEGIDSYRGRGLTRFMPEGGEALVIIFAVVLLFSSIVFYLCSPKNKINKACSIYIAIASVGVLNEVFVKQIVPLAQSLLGGGVSDEAYFGIYSAFAWVSYTLAMPAFLIAGLYIYGFDGKNPKLFRILRIALWAPAVVLPFLYHPVNFTVNPMEGSMLWAAYSLFNLGYGAVGIWLIIKGARTEKSDAVRRHKALIATVMAPPTVYVLIAVFVIRPLGPEEWFDAWQWNVVIVSISILIFLVMAFKDGFLGLKLSAQSFDWASGMDLVGKGTEYTNHMLKNQTAKMDLCIEHLKSRFASDGAGEIPEELDILSRSISTLKSYVDKMKRHSQGIRLIEEPCGLSAMVYEAMPVTLRDAQNSVKIHIALPEGMVWICDKAHITEVFANIITNAAEAISGSGSIEITGLFDKPGQNYCLTIADTGAGMGADELNSMFNPYFTTKNTERNFGLGLTYCKNVLEKHGGGISAKSKPGKGTAVTISFPSKRAYIGNGRDGREDGDGWKGRDGGDGGDGCEGCEGWKGWKGGANE